MNEAALADLDLVADPDFAPRIVAWQRKHGRHDLPWQQTRDAYRVWLSEIMLQQTQVAAVMRYYARFLERFPTVHALAAAPIDEVMAAWSGLGYYSRARNLHACAARVVEHHDGVFPHDPTVLASLPGIGRSTAAAIAAFAYGVRAAILDGNVKRVFARHWAVDGWPGDARIERSLWRLADGLLPHEGIEAYTQGLMDLGATVCVRTRPTCERCPVAATCAAHRAGRTDALPTPKPRKAVPVRDAWMLVAQHDGDVLLERRPARGLWGGLWSLPQFATRAELDLALAPLAPFTRRESLAPRTHGFTHFTLHFTPYLAQLATRPPRTDDATHLVWHPLAELDHAPLPAPVRRLLEDVARHTTIAWG